MPTRVPEEVVDVPRPVGVFLEAVYIILIAVGILCSFVTACCFLWKFFDDRLSRTSSTVSTEATSDKETQIDEDPCEESDGSVYFEDTDEDYIRGVFW